MVVDLFKFCSPGTLTNLIRASIFAHTIDMLLESTLVGWTLLNVNLFFLEFFF
jgi:hypothetical protein